MDEQFNLVNLCPVQIIMELSLVNYLLLQAESCFIASATSLVYSNVVKHFSF